MLNIKSAEVDQFKVTPGIEQNLDKLDERTPNRIVHLESQIKQLETAEAKADKQMKDYKKTIDSQEKEIQHLSNANEKLTNEKTTYVFITGVL